MATVTLKVHFRNIMLFVNHDTGTDVWFVAKHEPRLITRDVIVPLDGRVLTFLGNGAPLPDARTDTRSASLIVDFGDLAHTVALHPDLITGTLRSATPARVELRGSGRLYGPPSHHSFGSFVDWSFPGKGVSGVHTQKLTELATYEVPGVELPVTARITDPTRPGEPQDITLSESGDVEVMVLAGEIEKPDGGVRVSGANICIDEFKLLHACFDAATQSHFGSVNLMPCGTLPAGLPTTLTAGDGGSSVERSAYPYCPGGRVRRP
jgi:hypothetical protein